MKIYTKKGDLGKTSLYGGTRVSKSNPKVEAYGDIDELLSYLGLIRDLFPNEKESIIRIQNFLFSIGSHIANDGKKEKIKLPILNHSEVQFLENEIDGIDKIVPPMTAFILPGGNEKISHLHIARTVCRRAERKVTAIGDDIDSIHLIYLNRLSDYLFMLSRKISFDLEIEEIKWIPKNQ